MSSCANPACCTMPTVEITAMSFYVEDTIRNAWRCILCDWSYSVFGEEMPHGLENVATEDTSRAPGPIPHHHFNTLSCINCSQYATFSEWQCVESGGIRCGACSTQHCAYSRCKKHPMLARNTLQLDPQLIGFVQFTGTQTIFERRGDNQRTRHSRPNQGLQDRNPAGIQHAIEPYNIHRSAVLRTWTLIG